VVTYRLERDIQQWLSKTKTTKSSFLRNHYTCSNSSTHYNNPPLADRWTFTKQIQAKKKNFHKILWKNITQLQD
jgi:methionine aminopeptidase